MKKVLTILTVMACLAGAQAFAFESLLMLQTGPGGNFGGTSQYFASGKAENVNYENQQQTRYSGIGTFPSVVIYAAKAGAVQSQESFTMSSGFLNTLSKTATTTLTLTVNPDDEKVTNGVLVQNAAGVSNRLVGAGTSNTITGTAGGLVLQTETVGVFTSARIAVGGVQYVTTGSGPTDGGEGNRTSAITERFDEHYRSGGFTFGKLPGVSIGFQYGVSFNPAVSLLPPIR